MSMFLSNHVMAKINFKKKLNFDCNFLKEVQRLKKKKKVNILEDWLFLFLRLIKDPSFLPSKNLVLTLFPPCSQSESAKAAFPGDISSTERSRCHASNQRHRRGGSRVIEHSGGGAGCISCSYRTRSVHLILVWSTSEHQQLIWETDISSCTWMHHNFSQSIYPFFLSSQ